MTHAGARRWLAVPLWQRWRCFRYNESEVCFLQQERAGVDGHSLYLGRCFRIPVRVHATWPVSFLLIAASLGAGYYPQAYPGWSLPVYAAAGVVTSLLIFVSIVAHELAHCLVARWRGLEVHDIVLFLLGGVSQIDREPSSPSVELAMAMAGPLASLALAVVLGLVWLVCLPLAEPLAAMSGYVAGLNGAVAVFNLMPGFPLDGGRVVRALLWWRNHDLARATNLASILGRLVAYGFVGVGIWQACGGYAVDAVWFALIGGFLDRAARASRYAPGAEVMDAGSGLV